MVTTNCFLQTHAWKGNWKDSFPYPAETKHTDELVKGNWKDIFPYSALMQTQHTQRKVKGNGKDIFPYSGEAKMIGWFTRHHENMQNWRQKGIFYFFVWKCCQNNCGTHSCFTFQRWVQFCGTLIVRKHYNTPYCENCLAFLMLGISFCLSLYWNLDVFFVQYSLWTLSVVYFIDL